MPAFPLDNRGNNLHDRLGSVRILINTSGTVLRSYNYDPFGGLFDSEKQENVTNPYQFAGQWFDAEINQYCLRARMYDPQFPIWPTEAAAFSFARLHLGNPRLGI